VTDQAYDVIVVGARCAGSPLALLMARQGYRVLLLDRATFPSDTVSTHVIHPPGVAALARWGLLDQVVATGCPPVGRYSFDFGPIALAGAPGSAESPYAYAPRRTLLDKILVDAAAAAGAEVREGFTVEEVLFAEGQVAGIRGRDQGGASVEERARVVVGADGRNSVVAKMVRPAVYEEQAPLTVGYYSYWSDLPTDSFEAYSRPGRGWAVCPTNDGLTLVIGGWPHADSPSTATTSRPPCWPCSRARPRSPRGSVPPSARSGWSARRCRTTSGPLTEPVGRWSVTLVTAGTSSQPRASRTRSSTPRPAPGRWTPPSPARRPTTSRWPDITPAGTPARCRFTR
jgi:2-polyprenyl-6-methoxyphenol hydroxylase-like FAD-dependent oxidoreductase